MMMLIVTALAMGSIGSLHCIGMCGPIALGLPLPVKSLPAKLLGSLLYNLGRTFTYASLGAMAGLLGASAGFFGFQQWLSIAMGVAILVYLLRPRLSFYKNGHSYFQKYFGKLRAALSVLFKSRKYSSVFFVGVLNGLLPCGLVYMALAAAISTGSVIESSIFMGAFGLGTLPLMWALTFWGNLASFKMRMYIRKCYPYLLFAMACLLLIRGAGFGIPYLSPAGNFTTTLSKKGIECHISG